MGQNSNITAQLDNIVSRIIKKRDPFCVIRLEGCTRYTDDPAHVFGRSQTVRWNLRAVYGACRNCHNYVDTHPKEKEEIFTDILGEAEYERLKYQSNQTADLLPSDLKDLRKDLRTELKFYAQ